MNDDLNGGSAPDHHRLRHLPEDLRETAQWSLAGASKAPLSVDENGKLYNTSVLRPSEWLTFEQAVYWATHFKGQVTTHVDKQGRTIVQTGLNVGYILNEADPFCAIDFDVKDAVTHPNQPELWTTQEQLDFYWSIALRYDTYTERSRSGKGLHLWVRGKIGAGRKHNGVEVYSQERFIICTGDVVLNRPIAERQAMLTHMVGQMRPHDLPVSLKDEPEKSEDSVVLERANRAANGDRFRDLLKGDWAAMGYKSQSEADMALLSNIAFYTSSNEQVRRLFRQSALGTRAKATKSDRYLDRTLALIRSRQATEAAQLESVELNLTVHPARSENPPPGVNYTGQRELVGRHLGDVQARSIEWLWTGWIPKGYITIFAGETGAGKSTVLADIAARVTTGAPWPGEHLGERRAAARVLWLGSEDGIEEMTVPRLMACGANLHNVIEIQGVAQRGRRETFSMQDDLDAVSQWLGWASGEGRPFAMLVIDPVTSYLPGQRLRKVDLNDAGQLRTILEPWLVLAQKHTIAIVCVTHFAKDTTRAMLHRVLGSAAFAQTCRSLCAVVEPPTTDEYEPGPFEKAMIQVKVNLPEHPGGAWKFSTEKVEVATDPRNGKPITATRPNWEELDSALTPKTAVGASRGPKSQQEPAFATWLKGMFAVQPSGTWLPVDTVKWSAVRESVASESWWNKHSGDHLEKQNVAGTWMCRPWSAVPSL